jgi:hypothetical protein
VGELPGAGLLVELERGAEAAALEDDELAADAGDLLDRAVGVDAVEVGDCLLPRAASLLQVSLGGLLSALRGERQGGDAGEPPAVGAGVVPPCRGVLLLGVGMVAQRAKDLRRVGGDGRPRSARLV